MSGLISRVKRADPRAFYCGPRWLAVPAHTGGTSGAPLTLLRSARVVAFEQAFIDFVRLKVPASMAVEIHCVDELERTALGKTPFVIHRPAVKQSLAAIRAQPVTA
jgi:hypothetical protein